MMYQRPRGGRSRSKTRKYTAVHRAHVDKCQTNVLYKCLRHRHVTNRDRSSSSCSSLAGGAAAYVYLHRAPAALVLTGIVTTNDVIVSPQIGGQIGQLLVNEGDVGEEGPAPRRHRARRTAAPTRAYYAQNVAGLSSQVQESRSGAPLPAAADDGSDPAGRIDAGVDRGAGRCRRGRPRKRAADLLAHAEPVDAGRRLAAGARPGANRGERRRGQARRAEESRWRRSVRRSRSRGRTPSRRRCGAARCRRTST